MTPVYEVLYDTVRLGDGEVDARVVRVSGAAPVSWCVTQPPALASVDVEGNADRLSALEFPVNQLGWPILSRPLWDALGRPGRAVPVRVHDSGLPRGALDDRFVVMHLPPSGGLFDAGRSEWEDDGVFPGEPGRIVRLAFRPDVGLPRAFRLTEAPGRLFVSRAARLDLLDVATSGVRFRPVLEPQA